jgi:hypothetical protein
MGRIRECVVRVPVSGWVTVTVAAGDDEVALELAGERVATELHERGLAVGPFDVSEDSARRMEIVRRQEGYEP